MVKSKVQASSSRVLVPGGFGQSAFETSTSTLSYLAQLPDFSNISDPTTVVIFKNLLKKDNTTKARALEDLQTKITDDVEDAVLDVWAAVYPRTSIEISRRVRQLAHIIQGQICVAAGKRIARYLPDVVPCWILALYDNDKLVANAAQSALQNSFSSPEKQKTLLERYQSSILDICFKIIEDETPQTLSDERVVAPDEAEAKYHRVISSAIGTTTYLITTLDEKHINKSAQEYRKLANDKKLWSLVASEDATVRRQIHRLMQVIIQNSATQTFLDLGSLSSSYVSKGLESEQKGAAIAFLDSLQALTSFQPTIWTSAWSNKKSPLVRFRHFLKGGSHGSQPDVYWRKLTLLLKRLPPELFSSTENIEEILNAYQKGVNGKDEPRLSLPHGLNAFVATVSILTSHSALESRDELQTCFILPIIESCVLLGTDRKWDIPQASVGQVARGIMQSRNGGEIVTAALPNITKQLVEDVRSSSTESSNFSKAQDIVAEKSKRLAEFIGQSSASTELILPVLETSLEVLKTTAGTAYGAAAVIYEIIRSSPELTQHASFQLLLTNLLGAIIPSIFVSPSMGKLSQVLSLLRDQSDFWASWSACYRAVGLLPPDAENRKPAYKSLLNALETSTTSPTTTTPTVSTAILLHFAMTSMEPQEPLLPLASLLDLIPLIESIDDKKTLISSIFERISSRDHLSLVESIHLCDGLNEDRIQRILDLKGSFSFVSTILAWSETDSADLTARATGVMSKIRKVVKQDASLRHRFFSDFIHKELRNLGAHSLTPSILAKLAKSLDESGELKLNELSIPVISWEESLKSMLCSKPGSTIYVCSPLQGTIFQVQVEENPTKIDILQQDQQGLSFPVRASSFVAKLFEDKRYGLGDMSKMGTILKLIVLTNVLVNEDIVLGLSRLGSNQDSELTNYLNHSLTFIAWALTSAGKSEQETRIIERSIESVRDLSGDRSPLAYHNAMAYHHLIDTLVQTHGSISLKGQDSPTELMEMRKIAKSSPFKVMAFLSANQSSLETIPTAVRWYNEIIADLTGPVVLKSTQIALDRLILLQSMISRQEKSFLHTAAHQRIVFFIRGMISWFADENTPPQILTIAMSIITKLSPLLIEVYGDHWEPLLAFIGELWLNISQAWDPLNQRNETLLPLLYESLRLEQQLRKLSMNPECNEDLIEALEAQSKDLNQGMLELLLLERETNDELHLPLKIVNSLIARMIKTDQIAAIVTDTAQLYPLLATKSESIQEAAFNILHAQIPKVQENVAVEVALGEYVAKLPDELISLIMDPPPTKEEALMDWLDVDISPDYDEVIPLKLKGYFLSWVLIFDHFKSASHKLKEQYVESLKDGDYVKPLLTFIFHLLSPTDTKIKSIPGLDVNAFKLDSTSGYRETLDGLVAHIYYLCLVYVSTLTKTWVSLSISKTIS